MRTPEANFTLRVLSAGLLAVMLTSNLSAQAPVDSTRKHTIKLDLTSQILYQNPIVFSYERTVKPTQTYAITAGVQQFPHLKGSDTLNVTKDTKANGYKFGFEYRFFLKKENRYNAPHGLYIGPYTTYLTFSNKRVIEVENDGTIETANLTSRLNIINFGVELGYQFVLNDRWTLDFVFVGPSISNYYINMKLDGNYTFDAEDVENAIIAKLIDRFPGIEDLINEEGVSARGRVNSWAYGYRYQFLVGYHFGRKKNKK